MKEKNLIILCVVFAVLMSLVFVKKSMNKSVPTVEEVTNIIEPLLSGDTVSKIVVRIGNGISEEEDKPKNVSVLKENDSWIVETQYGVYANESVITKVLEGFDLLEGELRSDNKEVLADYGIDDASGVHVEFYRPNAEKIHVLVGTKQAGYQNNFVRFGDKNAVYAVAVNLLASLSVRDQEDDKKIDANRWVDKKIARIDSEDVVAFKVVETQAGQELTVVDLKRELVDGKKKWKSNIPYSFGMSASKIKNVFSVFNNTHSREIIAPDTEGVFDGSKWVGSFTLTDGGKIKIIRGNKDDTGDNYYVKREGATYHYLVPASTFNSRMDQQGNIFAGNVLGINEKSLESVEINSLEKNKVFSVIKKVTVPEVLDGQDTKEGEQPKESEPESTWETPTGELIAADKIQDMINKLKNINPEIMLQPAASVENSMVISITKNGSSSQYTIGKDVVLDTGKECRFLKVDANEQGYCVSKSAIVALENILP